MSTEKVDVLVIGAGPAGTVAASIVNKAGFKVKIVEKQQFPRFVIGESLLPRCMEALTEAGFLDAVKERGFQEKFGAKFVKNGRICDYFFADQFTPGWSWTWHGCWTGRLVCRCRPVQMTSWPSGCSRNNATGPGTSPKRPS